VTDRQTQGNSTYRIDVAWRRAVKMRAFTALSAYVWWPSKIGEYCAWVCSALSCDNKV